MSWILLPARRSSPGSPKPKPQPRGSRPCSLHVHHRFLRPLPSDMQIHDAASILSVPPNPRQPGRKPHRTPRACEPRAHTPRPHATRPARPSRTLASHGWPRNLLPFKAARGVCVCRGGAASMPTRGPGRRAVRAAGAAGSREAAPEAARARLSLISLQPPGPRSPTPRLHLTTSSPTPYCEGLLRIVPRYKMVAGSSRLPLLFARNFSHPSPRRGVPEVRGEGRGGQGRGHSPDVR